ncbi:hypothetical protein GCK32_015052, partial [Trichostrongylus colubriformis]
QKLEIRTQPTFLKRLHRMTRTPITSKRMDRFWQVLAGVTCAGNYRACDQAAFMPHPLPTPNCYDQPYLDDDHPAKRINGFYLDVPDSCTTNQEVRLWRNLSKFRLHPVTLLVIMMNLKLASKVLSSVLYPL